MESISKSKTPSKSLKCPTAVRFCDMIDMGPGSITKSATPKPFRFQPVRMCDMIKELEESAKKNKQVRKQLWSGKKENKRMTVSVNKRLSTTMKPEKNVRKTMFNKPAIAKVVSTIKKTYSSDDTLPLMNLENFEQNLYFFKKPINSPGVKKDQKLNPKRLSFKTNVKGSTRSTLLPKAVENKTGSANKSSIPRKTNRLTPRDNKNQPKTTPRVNKSLLKTNTNPRVDETKSELTVNEHILEIFNKKIDELYSKVDKRFSEIIERLNKLELESSECKNCGCKINSDQKTISPQIVVSQQDGSKMENLNNSCYIVENNPKINLNNSTEDNSGLGVMRTPEVNNLINNALINIDLKQHNLFSTNKTKSVVQGTLEIFDSPCLKPVDNKIITKFELLESKLKYGSPMSDEFSLSDTESPIVTKDITWLLNDKDDGKLHKSLSTPSVSCVSKKKSVTFHSKSQNDLHDPISTYNDMRTNIKFLCTPKNTRTVSNLMTPSVTNNHKKLLSRQIQKQLQMLD